MRRLAFRYDPDATAEVLREFTTAASRAAPEFFAQDQTRVIERTARTQRTEQLALLEVPRRPKPVVERPLALVRTERASGQRTFGFVRVG